MRQTDLPAIVAIAEQAHPSFPEDLEVFAEKQRLFEPFCFTLELDGAVAGYGFAHPWMRDRVPALNRLIGAPENSPDCIFVHDVALAPQARGKNASGALVARLAEVAGDHGLGVLALVSLYGADRAWRRHGFVPTDIAREAIAAYGPTALYMVRALR
jgi:GNAT superfamily N-acetyltransferase